MLNIELSSKAFEKFINGAPKDVMKAVKATARRAAVSGQKAYNDAIGEVSYLKSGVIRKAVRKPRPIKTSSMSVEYEVRVNGDVIGLDHFKVKPRRVTAHKGQQSKNWRSPMYKLGPGESWYQLHRHGRASAGFMAVMRRWSKLMFFRRFGSKVARAYGVSPQYFASFDVAERIVTHKVTETFNKRFEHELYYYLGKRGRIWVGGAGHF